jgi:hypothetical protein
VVRVDTYHFAFALWASAVQTDGRVQFIVHFGSTQPLLTSSLFELTDFEQKQRWKIVVTKRTEQEQVIKRVWLKLRVNCGGYWQI